MTKMHKIELSPDMVARVMKRRGGKLHAFERIDPAKTALVVIDMQNAWVKPGMPAYTPYCEPIVQAPPQCPADRPVGTPPNCCPQGTHFTEGSCYPLTCSPGWTGAPPHCLPPPTQQTRTLAKGASTQSEPSQWSNSYVESSTAKR